MLLVARSPWRQCMTHGCAVVGCTGVVRQVGSTGRGIPGSSTQRLHWYCQGPTSVELAVSAPTKALQAPAGPSAHLGSPHSVWRPVVQIGRDFIKYILKLVIMSECHLNNVIRPVILPVSKPGPKYTTLNFQDFLICQPSLHRNKWS